MQRMQQQCNNARHCTAARGTYHRTARLDVQNSRKHGLKLANRRLGLRSAAKRLAVVSPSHHCASTVFASCRTGCLLFLFLFLFLLPLVLLPYFILVFL